MTATSSGRKLMLQPLLNKPANIREGVFYTLAFFNYYGIPISFERLHGLLYKFKASPEELRVVLVDLVKENKIVFEDNLYALAPWDKTQYQQNQQELKKRWQKVYKYYWLLSGLPFVRQISVINSLSIGNANSESDIDFLIITHSRLLYFVRSVIITIFKLFGVYKTREKVNEQFCFGFYTTLDNLDFSKLLLPEEDPYFAFWLACLSPIYSEENYLNLITANSWLTDYFPNFTPNDQLQSIQKENPIIRAIKVIKEFAWFLPGLILEPLLRRIHIRHTFALPENHWPSASTVATKNMLKLHALDPRKEIREKFYEILSTLKF